MKSNKVVLLDMDGTITPARRAIEPEMILQLKELSNYADIGIVTGSDMGYLKQQCRQLWNTAYVSGPLGVSPDKIILMPCNGTQLYRWDDGIWKKDFSLNMKEHIGEDKYREIIKAILSAQNFFMNFYNTLPVSGNFISYRNSMINWCPIGRDCSFEDRDAFSDEDIENRIRKYLKQTLISKIDINALSEIIITLGGNTSFDIYPSGWDKSFALKHFADTECWFVGDRCFEDGNDRAIYEALLNTNRAFSTSSTENTIEIINKIISKIK
jgi:phosphomannomutase